MLLLNRPVLVLDRGFQAYDSTTLDDAFKSVENNRAQFVDEMYNTYDIKSWFDLPVPDGATCVHTVRNTLRIPEVMRFKHYEKKRRSRVIFSRKNLFKRDHWRCQYCGKKPRPDEITMDHVDPRTNGGVSCFTNCVLACLKCNLKKAGRTPEQAGMRLRRLVPRADGTFEVEFYYRPEEPAWSPYYNLPNLKNPPDSWKNFLRSKNDELYWHVELEP